MLDLIESAVKTAPEHRSMILVIGKSGAGKTTLIDACTKERYSQKYQADSNRSHTSGVYPITGNHGLRRRCFFHEEPSFLEDPHDSYRLFIEFVDFLLSEEGERVTGIVYVLNHQQESLVQQTEHEAAHKLTFKSHLEFARSWIGNNCPRSTILTVNRQTEEEISSPTSGHIASTWSIILNQQSIDIMGDDPNGVIRTLLTSTEHKLHLWNEIYGKEKKNLRKTELGKLYTEQLNKWIENAKKKRTTLKAKRQNLDSIDLEIKRLKGYQRAWKDLKYPPKYKNRR